MCPVAFRGFDNGRQQGALRFNAPALSDVAEDEHRTEDLALRNNRLALLSELHAMMNRVADISKLAT